MLVGFMGAGKSTVGRALAAELQCAFEDLDERIERSEGRTVPEIFRQLGEAQFRKMERTALRALLDELRSGVNKVVALGGGAFVQPANARLIAESGWPTIFLDAPVDELWRRCCSQGHTEGADRPLLQRLEEFQRLYRLRRPKYSKATVRQETSGKDIRTIVSQILQTFGWSGTLKDV